MLHASVLRAATLARCIVSSFTSSRQRAFSILACPAVWRHPTEAASVAASNPFSLSTVRTFKDVDVLSKRCKDCYFKKMDDRWYTLCKTHGRHKQRQRMPDDRHFWIVTHRTRGPRKNF